MFDAQLNYAHLFPQAQTQVPQQVTPVPDYQSIQASVPEGNPIPTLPEGIGKKKFSIGDLPKMFMNFMNDKQAAWHQEQELKKLSRLRLLDILGQGGQQGQVPQQAQLPAQPPMVMSQQPLPQQTNPNMFNQTGKLFNF